MGTERRDTQSALELTTAEIVPRRHSRFLLRAQNYDPYREFVFRNQPPTKKSPNIMGHPVVIHKSGSHQSFMVAKHGSVYKIPSEYVQLIVGKPTRRP